MSRDDCWLDPSFEHRAEVELPEGWSHVALGNLGSWGTGGTPSKARAGYWEHGTVPWVSPKDMKASFISDAQDRITEYAVRSGAADLVPPGTLLFVVRGMILAHSFPVALTTREVAFNQDLRSLVPFNGVCGPYLLRALQHEAMNILFAVKEATHGTLRLESPTLRAWPIPLPPLAEQRRIVAKVDALLAEVNAARDRLATLPAMLTRFRESVLLAACSWRLTESWRERLGRNGASDWTERPIGGCLAEPMANGRSVPDGNGFRVLRLTAVRAGKIDLTAYKTGAWTAADAARFVIRKGDFLVVRGNGSLHMVGRGALVEDDPDAEGLAYPDTLIRIRARRDTLTEHFLRLVWNSNGVRGQIEAAAHTSAGIHKVSQSDLAGILIPVPPIDEQDEIVRRVDALFAAAEMAERHGKDARASLETMSQAILAKAFRGELVPTEAELARQAGRNYESASVLLERIRRERHDARDGEATDRPATRRRPSPRPN